MKIMIALHSCMDLGGIINHTEQLIGGLKDLGHTVHLKQFVWSIRASGQNRDGDFLVGPSGIPHHQGKGWNFPSQHRIPYRGGASLNSAKQILSGYDLIIWTVPVPPKNKDNEGNSDWPELYDLPSSVKQIAFVHDGNARNGAPHIMMIQDKLAGIAAVHACALNGSDFLTVPRALVLNPQLRPVRGVAEWNDRAPGFVNMQTFKAWKHVHELIEAIAYMPKKMEIEYREVAGKGIEYQYMTSEDKCKPEYFHTYEHHTDDHRKWFHDMKFWDVALANGMTHHDYWDSDEVERWLQTARVLVDPSWSHKYAKVGGHWNRVVVDAMINGAIPVATEMGMGSELFKAGVHYVAVEPGGLSPAAYANTILETGNMKPVEALRFREANLELLPLFDRKAVAQRLLNLAFGELDATEIRVGKTDPDVKKKFEDLMYNHYGVLA
jgi:glycosyltransferase involved in cell wall biosynthesis